ncbi:DUF5133 domain-containing protein [Streptomyces sp. M2CJ-2]|uniref:DUF5133 domain-containing protein n=1 Tax=Streptomyces sp. M2CJ-2 TaxID=2803948 RepID=UPI001929064F|nr:DUF5133 domain-containing protein [Streptomyces sp. M2CJ-2]MBL3669896.1 DUF5133 domain-containing protein [Streptomyces sp. M2CJ-2]
MLLPARAEVARQLRRYRAWERVMLAAPTDRTVRTTFEDSGYTLCVLMGKRCAREAADAAERYLRTSLVTYLQEQNEWTRPAANAWPGPAANDRPRPTAPPRRVPPSIERRSPAGR